MRNWTPEARARQAELCRRHKPWAKSTGPKTEAGKAAVSQNARRQGFRSADFAYICAVLRAQRLFVKEIVTAHKQLNRKRKLTPRINSDEQTDMLLCIPHESSLSGMTNAMMTPGKPGITERNSNEITGKD